LCEKHSLATRCWKLSALGLHHCRSQVFTAILLKIEATQLLTLCSDTVQQTSVAVGVISQAGSLVEILRRGLLLAQTLPPSSFRIEQRESRILGRLGCRRQMVPGIIQPARPIHI